EQESNRERRQAGEEQATAVENVTHCGRGLPVEAEQRHRSIQHYAGYQSSLFRLGTRTALACCFCFARWPFQNEALRETLGAQLLRLIGHGALPLRVMRVIAATNRDLRAARTSITASTLW